MTPMIDRATISDTAEIVGLVNKNAQIGLMLGKSPYDIYRNVLSFFVFRKDGAVVGCARLRVVWKNLAEICSIAVEDELQNHGIGRQLVRACVEEAKRVRVEQVFALTYQCDFFAKCGFREVPRESLPHKVFGDCLNCPKVECCDERAFIMDIVQ